MAKMELNLIHTKPVSASNEPEVIMESKNETSESLKNIVSKQKDAGLLPIIRSDNISPNIRALVELSNSGTDEESSAIYLR